jgi:hypothetical protein
MGRLAFPFMGQGMDLGYTRKREKNREGDSPGAVLPFSSASGSYRRQQRRVHVAAMPIFGAIGGCHHLWSRSLVRNWCYR